MWQFIIPAIGQVLGSLAGGRSEGRQAASATNLQRDALANQQYGTQQSAILQALLAAESGNMGRANLDLNRRQFSLNAPNQRGATAVRGDLMSRAQDVNISHPRATIPKITGGFTPSMLSPETRQTGQSMTRNALMQQLKGDEFSDVPAQNWGGAVLTPPNQTPLPEANGFDKFLSVAAPIASLAGGIATGVQGSRNDELIKRLLQQASQSNMGAPQVTPWQTPPFNPNVRWTGAP